MSNLNEQQQKNFEMENQAAMKALSEAARRWREKQAKKATAREAQAGKSSRQQ